MINQAVILAGGLGSRLRGLTKCTPKPLLEVAGKPFLYYLLWNLKRHGIKDIVFSVGYLAKDIQNTFGDGHSIGLNIRYAVERRPLGTGGGLRNCLPYLNKYFFVVNGDTLFDINYNVLSNFLYQHIENFGCTIALRKARNDSQRYGSVVLRNSQITQFEEEGVSNNMEGVLINGGIYLLSRCIVSTIPNNTTISIEKEIFPNLVLNNRLTGVQMEGFFLDIGMPDTFAQAQSELPKWQKRPAVFLDRDGVINKDTGHLHRSNECLWVSKAPEAIRMLNEKGYLVIVVTNQAGIGRGLYTEVEFHNFMNWYQGELADGYCAHLDAVYYCPFHPTDGKGYYLKDSNCRKPRPGMILKALNEWPIIQEKSFLIGDKVKDVEAAESAGIKGILFDGSDLKKVVKNAMAST